MNHHFSYGLRSRMLVLLMGAPALAVAQGRLPTLEDPSRGVGSGILQPLQNYSDDIILLIALLVVLTARPLAPTSAGEVRVVSLLASVGLLTGCAVALAARFVS